MNETQKLPAVAQRICLDCKKCGCERYFTVVAHTTEKSAKVECEVCKSKKTYKLPSAKKKTGGKTSTPRRSSVDKHAQKWTELRDQFATGEVKPYSMAQDFALNAAIQHPKFGLGIVTQVFGHMIQVTFEDVDRSLVHRRT
ncbi:MAG: hypothetical protein IT288_13770 [Bdellovibrionales bacterium]|nr:hypothetical protein [Bdellovibrionales bacterium]